MTHHPAPEIAVEAWYERLLAEGYCIVPDALRPQTIAALDADLAPVFARTPFCAGGFYGETTKRFGRLLTRSDHARTLVQHRLILALVERVLEPWCDTIQLNVAQAIGIHPGAPKQMPHRDQEMWRAPPGAAEYLVNVIWPLTPFVEQNGATVVWPGSHMPEAPDPQPEDEGVAAEMEPGSALIFLGSTLHGAGSNRTNAVRRGIVIGYSLGWLKPYENQWLAYPPEVARGFSPELASLVGYRQHRPNLGNFEGRCPSILLADRLDPDIGAADALRPDQKAAVDAFVDLQRLAS